MKRALALAVAALSALLVPGGAWAFAVETVQDTGPSDKRIDITVLGDGYRDIDQAKLSDDARSILNSFFGEAPFKQYRALFNVKLVHVVSAETGADNGTYGVTRNTALGAYFYCNGIDRLLCVSESGVRQIAARDTPGYDVLIVIVNDPMYGGSGGGVATISLAPAAALILVHELGHTFAGLADEYSDPYPDYPACPTDSDCPEPNATLHATRATAKWSAWINPTTPVPTPSDGRTTEIGVYEGCRYQTTGVYRPLDAHCMMKQLDNAHYCSVCAEALVRAFWRRAPLVETFSPAASTRVTPCGPVTFSVAQPPIPGEPWRYLWTLDGAPVASDTARYTLSNTAVASGMHQVAVTVTDMTPLVRNDPDAVLHETQRWAVEFQSGAPTTCQPNVCEVAAACNSSGECVGTPKPAGEPCAPASCSDGLMRAASTCDGAGTCAQPEAVSCGPYTCDEAGAACRTKCSRDSECATGNVCSWGKCVEPAKRGPFGCLGCSSAGDLWAAASLLVLAARVRGRRSVRR